MFLARGGSTVYEEKLTTCWPSLFWMCSSLSRLQESDQLPMTSFVGLTRERMGWLGVPALIWLRTLCSFSTNSPRFSIKNELVDNNLI